jgi:integrase
LLDAYLLSEAFKEKAVTTQAIDRGRIERHLRPLLGKRHAHLLTENDIRRVLASIRDGKTATTIKTGSRGLARVTGGPGTARMAIDLLRAIFNFGIAEHMVTTNPCIGVKTGTSGIREIILEDVTDYARLFETLDKMEREFRIAQPAADAIRLVALTGCRRGEAAKLRWRHVELKNNRIALPPASHKTGRRTGKPKTITLTAEAQAIIARQPEREPNDYVFIPAKERGHFAC